MDRLESMSILLAVVEAGSLSGAARRVKMPLPTLSRKISELEAHLRTKLLNRGTRLLTLTDAGTSYLAAARRILEDVEAAERAASGEYNAPRGELIITSSVTFGRVQLVPVVADFLKAYPEIDVRLTFNDRVMNLQEEHIDLAARIGRLPDSSLIAIRLGDIRRVICASPEYLEARGTPLHPAELAGHDCVSFSPMSEANSWDFPIGGNTEFFPVHSRLVVTTADAAIDAAIAGAGITRLFCYHVAQPMRDGRLRMLLNEFEPPSLPVHLVYPAGRMMPLKLRAFLDFAAPRLKVKLMPGITKAARNAAAPSPYLPGEEKVIMPKESKAQKETIERVMHEQKNGELKTSTEKKVKSRKQAIAIALHEAGASNQESSAKNRQNLKRTKAREART
jgi:DNA-binding transcriptional LysR family regulator